MKMNKENKKTFAQRAKAIQAKYKRAEYDPIEARDMEAELESLMQEQESIRESMGLNQKSQESVQTFENGGGIYDHILDSIMNKRNNTTNLMKEKISSNSEYPLSEQLQIRDDTSNNIKLALDDIASDPARLDKFYQTLVEKGMIGPMQGYQPSTGDISQAIVSNEQSKGNAINNIGQVGVNAPYPYINPTNQQLAGSIVSMQPQVNTTTNPIIPTNVGGLPVNSPGQYTGKHPEAGWPMGFPNNQGAQTPPIVPQPSNKLKTPLVNTSKDNSLANSEVMGERAIAYNSLNPSPMQGLFNSPTQTILDSNQPFTEGNLGKMNTLSPEQKSTLETQGSKQLGKDTRADKWSGMKDMAPYAISGLSNIASNLILANMAKKNQPRMNAAMATPEKVNLEPQAEAMRQQAGVSKNVAMRNARNLGVNAGSALANMGAIGADVDRGLGQNLTNLYMQQEGANVGAANQFALANMQAQQQANQMNTGIALQGKENQLGYLSGAMGTIPGVMKDIRMDKADTEMRGIQKKYYESMGGKNYATVGDFFSDDQFDYEVKSVDAQGKITDVKKTKKK